MVDRLAAGLAHHAEQHRLVALADLTRLQRGTVVDELVAGGQHGHPGPPHHLDAPRADRGEHSRHGRGDQVAGPEQLRAGADVVAHPTNRRPRLDGSSDPDASPAVEPLGVLHHHRGVGAGGHRCAGHDPDRLARTHCVLARGTGGDLVDHVELHRRLARPGDVGGAHGVAVDGAVRERGHVLARDHGGSEHRPGGVAEGQLDGGQGRAPLEDVVAGVALGDHPEHGSERPGRLSR